MQKITVKQVQPMAKDGTMLVDENDTKFSGFLPELKNVQPGDIVEIDVRVKGKYNNITAVKILESHPVGNVNSQLAPKFKPQNNIDVERVMERQEAAKIAASISVPPIAVDKLLIDAARIAAWIAGEKEAPKPQNITLPVKTGKFINGIDMGWLEESLKTLLDKYGTKWSHAQVIMNLDRATGARSASVSEAVKLLNKTQAEGFVKEIQDAL